MNPARMRHVSSLPALAAFAFAAGLSLSSADARGQTEPPIDAPTPPTPPAPAAASGDAPSAPAPDVVKLKDGSMYRGEIIELVANDHVDIRLTTGAIKRFPMGDVAFAGASPSAAPPAPPPPPPAPPPRPAPTRPTAPVSTEVSVEFTSDTPDTEVYQKDGESVGVGYVFAGRASGVVAMRSKQFKRICGVPCTSSLEPGTYHLAMSKGDHAPVQDDDAVTIDGPSRASAKYTDNSGLRVAGWVTMGVTVFAGTLMMLEAFGTTQSCTPSTQYGSGAYGFTDPGYCSPTPTTNSGLLAAGAVVGIGGMLTGLVLILQHDHVSFRVTPLDSSSIASPLAGYAVERGRAAPQGAALSVTF